MKLNSGKIYKTSQREMVLSYLGAHNNACMSVQELYNELQLMNRDIGKTTVYRCLNQLIEKGLVKKYIAGKGDAASYQYIGDHGEGNHHYHLKCLKCGRTLHLDCRMMSQLDDHIFNDHHFSIDKGKSIFYGICESCKLCNK